MALTIITESGEKDLYCKYDGQCNPQDVYIEIDCVKEKIYFDHNAEIGNAVSSDVFNGKTLRYYVGTIPTGSGANKILDDICDLAQIVVDNWDEEYINNRYVGRLNKKGQKASDQIEEYLEHLELNEEDIIQLDDDGNMIKDDEEEV